VNARDAIIAKVLRREGGIADIGDGKGITRFGQTPDWLHDFNLPVPSTAADAAENYAAWLRVTRLDRVIGDTPDVLADVVIDYAVHSGHVPAIQSLQHAVKVEADGVIGPVTLEAIRIDSDRKVAAARIIAQRGQHQGWLITRKPDRYAKFAHGWANRQAEFIVALVS
jgi:lysozyme family protein